MGPETVDPGAVTVVGHPCRERDPDASPDVFSRDIRDMIPRRQQLIPVHPTGPSPPFRHGRALAFHQGILLLPSFFNLDPETVPPRMCFLAEPSEAPRPISILQGRGIADGVVRGPTLHVLSTRPAPPGFQKAIHATTNLAARRPVATWTADTFARSFEEAHGRFYVSLGGNSPRRKNLPPATGSILQVIPAPRTPGGLARPSGQDAARRVQKRPWPRCCP